MPAASLPARHASTALGVTLLLHGLLVWLLYARLEPRPGVERSDLQRSRIELRLIPDAPRSMPPAPPAAQTPRRAGAPRPLSRVAPLPLADSPLTPASETTVLPRWPMAPAPTPAIEADAPSAPSVLDSAATRRAISESARGTGPAAQQAAEATASLRGPTANDRLAGQIEQAGRGDCLKGDYAGAGLGLLSLPFLAAALLRDDCAK